MSITLRTLSGPGVLMFQVFVAGLYTGLFTSSEVANILRSSKVEKVNLE